MIRFARNRGFSLVLMAVLLLIIGGGVVWMLAMVPAQHSNQLDASSEQMTDEAHAALLGFLFTNARLPCPDANNDGAEDCPAGSNPVGALPYRTLRLPQATRNSVRAPLRYAAYLGPNATLANDAELTAYKNRYVPDIPDPGSLPAASPALTLASENLADFCVALNNAQLAAADAGRVHVLPGVINVAYVLVDAGADARFDGENNDANVAFAALNTPHTSVYDDVVTVVPLQTLSLRLGCRGFLAALNAIVLVTKEAKLLADQAQSVKDSADQAVVMAIVDAVIQAGIVAIAIAEVVGAAATLAKATAICAASLGLAVNACAAIAVAGTALGLAGGAAVLSAAALAAQIASAVAAGNNATTAGNLLTSANNRLANAIIDAVRADMRGGIR